jgi:hypothetical protein
MPITVLNPTGRSDAQPLRAARRLTSLGGVLIGILDNRKVNADRILQLVAQRLQEQHGVREIIWRRKHNFSAPAPAEMLAELSACDAIITGVGD